MVTIPGERCIIKNRLRAPCPPPVTPPSFTRPKLRLRSHMYRYCSTLYRSIRIIPVFFSLAAAVMAQVDDPNADAPSNKMFYLMFLMAIAGLGSAYYFWKKSKKGITQDPAYNYKNPSRDNYDNGSYDFGDVDADRELEWFRKSKKAKPARAAAKPAPNLLETREFQEKMRKLQYAQLPINSFHMLAPAREFEPLPLSSDPALLSAIEQTNEEYEEDDEIRELALRILMAFRTRNSVDALYQVALYDLSSNLRSKAVNVLTDFDHETVFEAILLACADPTREVRAAAARGLFRLNFDRAGAWTRIIETKDDFRMSHAARAAIEAGIVQKSFDRLIHEDMKISYEAFCLVALLIKAGEDQDVFDAIRHHKDERVKFALLHVIKAIHDERSDGGLTAILQEGKCSADVLERTRDILRSFDQVKA